LSLNDIIDSLFKLGALKYLDKVVVHPYRPVPEGVEQDLAQLTQIQQKYIPKAKPVWATEYGTGITILIIEVKMEGN
jgi:hypothetical protein